MQDEKKWEDVTTDQGKKKWGDKMRDKKKMGRRDAR